MKVQGKQIGWLGSVSAVFVLLLSGCQKEADTSSNPIDVARPVFARKIGSFQPTENRWVTGSVAAWKTEKVGFEVSGRVEAVVEPDQVIDGQVLSNNQILSPGTPLARLENQRFRIALQKAISSVKVAKSRRQSLLIQTEEAQKASLSSARAKQKLAEVEFQRAKDLFQQNAGTRADFDQAKANLDSAVAATQNTLAQIKGNRADLASMDAEIEQANQNVEIAQLDLKDTTLYSKFRGVVSEVHVVPGSLVRAGDPVVTIQMMDPMKIEFEVSAKVAKRFRRGDTVKLFTSSEETTQVPLNAFVYSTDPVADPGTRTFTVTLLARNPALNLPTPPELKDQLVARTTDLWPININSIVGTGENLLVEQSSIHKDAQGYYLWKALNRKVGQPSPSRVMEVSKVRVEIGKNQYPFFNWVFRPIRLLDPKSVDPEKDLFIGKLTWQGQRDQNQEFTGKHVMLEQVNWRLLPGDVVKVSLNKEGTNGVFVPFGAIVRHNQKTYIFLAEKNGSGKSKVKKMEVKVSEVHNSDSDGQSLCKIIPTDPNTKIDPSDQLITEGVHYLKDGETVKTISKQLGEIQ